MPPPPPPCTPVPHFPALAHRGGATCAGSKAFPALPPEEGRGGGCRANGMAESKNGIESWGPERREGSDPGFSPGATRG